MRFNPLTLTLVSVHLLTRNKPVNHSFLLVAVGEEHPGEYLVIQNEKNYVGLKNGKIVSLEHGAPKWYRKIMHQESIVLFAKELAVALQISKNDTVTVTPPTNSNFEQVVITCGDLEEK